jgi:hypothetical protein
MCAFMLLRPWTYSSTKPEFRYVCWVTSSQSQQSAGRSPFQRSETDLDPRASPKSFLDLLSDNQDTLTDIASVLAVHVLTVSAIDSTKCVPDRFCPQRAGGSGHAEGQWQSPFRSRPASGKYGLAWSRRRFASISAPAPYRLVSNRKPLLPCPPSPAPLKQMIPTRC